MSTRVPMPPFFRKPMAVLGIVAALTAVGPTFAAGEVVPSRSAGEVLDDATITASVKARILDEPRTDGFDINVDTVKGRVTLRGGADSLAAWRRAGDIARGTDGVLAVDNRIVVAAPGTEARTLANEATASGELRGMAEDAGDGMGDAWITSQVKTALVADADIAGFAINVVTKGKVVTLAGEVSSDALRAEAIRIAQATEGVVRVDATGLVVR